MGIRGKYLLALGLSIMMVAAIVPTVSCDQAAESGRQIVSKWQSAVVTVQLVIKTSVSYEGKEGPTEEEKLETRGLVIDPSGLVVTALCETDPGDMYADMFADEMDNYSVSTEVKDVKLLFGDGKEIPAKLVLRDKDLDLAFIRPTKKPDDALTAIDLAAGGKPDLFDPVIGLSRQGMVGNRAISISMDRIESIMEKPRAMYVPDQGLDFGTAVFAMDSKLIGMTVMRKLPSGASGANSWQDTATQAILPASDIAEAAKQAPAAE